MAQVAALGLPAPAVYDAASSAFVTARPLTAVAHVTAEQLARPILGSQTKLSG
jgi:hypothetical protein